jgi:membrane-bound metal-dependent hydrolase YbcI (DUF457 family)
VAALTGKPVSEFVLSRSETPFHPISWPASCLGAYVGTLSHIVLDAIMHSDMRPWWPFTSNNALLGYIPLSELHVMCLALGLAGGLGVWVRLEKRHRA